jgi:signal transduction histidine kinase
VRADQQAFHSTLSNLIQNAIKFTRSGGRIEVRGKLEIEDIIFEVECGGLTTDTTKSF